MRLGLLICGRVAPAAQGPGGDYAELFAALFADHDVSWHCVDLTKGELPGRSDAVDGWITTGSASSVYDELGWVPDALSFIRTLVDEARPYVGDCFGHQLLAVALGGRVERAEIGWRVGVQTYRVTQPLSWMTPQADSFRLIASHQDQVTVAPEGATVFADGPLCPVAGLAYGSAMSFQGHPEYTPELSRLLTMDRRERIGEEEARRGLASLDLGVTQPLIADWIIQFVRRTANGSNSASAG